MASSLRPGRKRAAARIHSMEDLVSFAAANPMKRRKAKRSDKVRKRASTI